MRGCERKIILLKGTESQVFDEAYFLVRRGFEMRPSDEIVREAERIIDRNTTRIRGREGKNLICFFAGTVCGIILSLLFFAIAM